MNVRVLALGNPDRGDDGAALKAVEGLPGVEPLGRPGIGLLDALEGDAPVVLVDVVRTGAAPGTVVSLALEEAVEAAIAAPRGSTHAMGPADALRLGRVLGRPLPRGRLVGCEGERYTTGAPLSTAVETAIPAWRAAIRTAIANLEGACTSTGSSTGS